MSVLIKIKSIIGLIKTLLFKNDRVYFVRQHSAQLYARLQVKQRVSVSTFRAILRSASNKTARLQSLYWASTFRITLCSASVKTARLKRIFQAALLRATSRLASGRRARLKRFRCASSLNELLLA